MKSYWQKLKDPKWQKKRLEIMQRDEFKCCICQGADIELNVHHKIYKKGSDPWDYEDHELATLCRPCHETITEQDTVIKEWLTGDANRDFILKFIELERCGYQNVESALFTFQTLITHELTWIFGENIQFKDASDMSFIMKRVAEFIDDTCIKLSGINFSVKNRMAKIARLPEGESK